jgi:hypothetical protein
MNESKIISQTLAMKIVNTLGGPMFGQAAKWPAKQSDKRVDTALKGLLLGGGGHILEGGTDRLFQNVGMELPLYAA